MSRDVFNVADETDRSANGPLTPIDVTPYDAVEFYLLVPNHSGDGTVIRLSIYKGTFDVRSPTWLIDVNDGDSNMAANSDWAIEDGGSGTVSNQIMELPANPIENMGAVLMPFFETDYSSVDFKVVCVAHR